MPGFKLPVPIFRQNPTKSIQEQLEHIYKIEGTGAYQDLWENTLSVQYLHFKNLKEYNTTSSTIPMIFYLVAGKIRYAQSNASSNMQEIMQKLAGIWNEIEQILEDTIADPTVLYGTAQFQSFLSRAYENDSELLRDEIKQWATNIPHHYGIYLNMDSNNLTFNQFLNLYSSELEKKIWTPTPIILNYTQSSSVLDEAAIKKYKIKNSENFTMIHSKTHNDLLSNFHGCLRQLIDTGPGPWENNRWSELKKLLDCYANAQMLSDDPNNIALACIVMYCFDEVNSIASSEFIKTFHQDNCSLLQRVFFDRKNEIINIEDLTKKLCSLTAQQRSDWIEGQLLLYLIKQKPLGNIEPSAYTQKHLLTPENIYNNPALLANAYGEAEACFQERIKSLLSSDCADKILIERYPQEICYMIERNIYETVYEIPFYWLLNWIEHRIPEHLAWIDNKPFHAAAIYLATILLSVVMSAAPVLLWLGIEGLITKLTERLGTVAGYVGAKSASSAVRKSVETPLHHAINSVDATKLPMLNSATNRQQQDLTNQLSAHKPEGYKTIQFN